MEDLMRAKDILDAIKRNKERVAPEEAKGARFYGYRLACDHIVEIICHCIPTVLDVKPVVRGKWELIERRIISKVQVWKCSNCGNFLEVRENTFNAGRGDCNYCPNCGADMREENHDNQR